MNMEDEEYHFSKVRTKGKSKTYVPKLQYVEVKPRNRRQGKCVGAVLEDSNLVENKPEKDNVNKLPSSCQYISDDIWFHLANYIDPEDVQRFSLVCRQSARSVDSRWFWLQLYRRYCQQTTERNSKKWVLQLPEHLQMVHIKGCDKNALRQKVIQALFYCYAPFKERLRTRYSLEILVGRKFISSCYKQFQSVWIISYMFKLTFPFTSGGNANKIEEGVLKDIQNIESKEVVHNWESLVDEQNDLCQITNSASSSSSTLTSIDQDGTTILNICCDRFIPPFPLEIVNNHSTNPFRLAASRELLSTDMRSINLELDFISSTKDQTVTVKYSKILKYEVLPWWHPDIKKFNECYL